MGSAEERIGNIPVRLEGHEREAQARCITPENRPS